MMVDAENSVLPFFLTADYISDRSNGSLKAFPRGARLVGYFCRAGLGSFPDRQFDFLEGLRREASNFSLLRITVASVVTALDKPCQGVG
jgi:hypothetical protein